MGRGAWQWPWCGPRAASSGTCPWALDGKMGSRPIAEPRVRGEGTRIGRHRVDGGLGDPEARLARGPFRVAVDRVRELAAQLVPGTGGRPRRMPTAPGRRMCPVPRSTVRRSAPRGWSGDVYQARASVRAASSVGHDAAPAACSGWVSVRGTLPNTRLGHAAVAASSDDDQRGVAVVGELHE